MNALKCPNCGAPMKPVIGTAFLDCEYCGSRCTRDAVGTGTGPTSESLTMRGEICLKAKQWGYAANCFQRALEIAPTYAPAYYGSLLAHWNCIDDEELSTKAPIFGNDSNYQNALRFGDQALQLKLEGALRKANENEAFRIEKARLEEKVRQKREQKRQETVARHKVEYQALIKRNRRVIWCMCLLSLLVTGISFLSLSGVNQIIYEFVGSYSYDIEEPGLTCYLILVLCIPAIPCRSVSMFKKAYGIEGKKTFVIAILFLVPSFILYVINSVAIIIEIMQQPIYILTFLLAVIPAGVVYINILGAGRFIKPLKQLEEAQQQELLNL